MPFQPFQYVNVAPARLSGVELESGYDWGAGFAAYAYNDRVSANFSVNNLLNREYTQFLNIDANPGLTVKGGITIKFGEK